MNREIKFRAWDKQNNAFAELYTNVDCMNNLDNDNVAIMQYSGLKDKNNKEIFEGDIIKIPDDYDTYGIFAGEIYEIYFAYGGFRLKPKNSKRRGNWLEDEKELEVIGNIYENKDLLPTS